MIDSEEKMSPKMWEMMLDYKLMLIVDDEFEKRSDQLEIIGFQSEDEDLCLKRSLLPNARSAPNQPPAALLTDCVVLSIKC